MNIQNKLTASRRLLLLAGVLATFQLHAASVSINNFSFEDDVLSFGNFTNNVLTDWTVVAATGDLVGAYNPNTFSEPVPAGSNTAYVNPGGEFYQDVGPLVANSTYNFTVF